MATSEVPAAPAPSVPIAIVGISAVMPGAVDADAFWRNVLEGRDMLTDVPPSRWLLEDFYDPDQAAPDKTYARRGAFLPEVDFDPMAFGLPPNNLPATDTAQLLALVAAERVLADAVGSRNGLPDGDRVSVILGSASLELLGELAARLGRPLWQRGLRRHGLSEEQAQAVCEDIAAQWVPWQEASFPGLLSNVVAGRIANRFDLQGSNYTVDAACASSLAALSAAVDDLVLGRADLAITGGVDTLNDPMMFVAFSKTPALSPTGDCRPFAEGADGTMLGEGLALFALKRLTDAERDGNHVYAVIRGVGSSSDGRSTSIYAPLATGQARALRRAYAAAGYGPGTVGLVEAHGTATAAGDLAEVAALRTVFEESGRADRQWCALGSVKSQVGHTKAAAGAAGLLKATLALHHKVLPATIKADRPNPELGLEQGPFHLNTTTRPWVHGAAHPRRAGVSSFGFGGTNFHVTLEEFVPSGDGGSRAAPRSLARPTELMVVSAGSPGELLSRCGEYLEKAEEGSALPALARASQREFKAGDEARLAVVATDAEDLAAKLRQVLARVREKPDASFVSPTGTHYGRGRDGVGRIAFLFPGQGSQYLGMGTDLAVHFPQAQRVWDRVDRLVLGDVQLSQVVFPPAAFTDHEQAAQRARLTATEWAQPAIAAHCLALLELLEDLGLRPDCAAGHSFGELLALHTARACDTETLLDLARRRGELMRDAAARPGAMLAVDATAENVTGLITGCGLDEAWVAGHNGPRQVTVSGSSEAIATLEAACGAAGRVTRRLDTATGFHSPLVAAAAGPLLDHLCAVPVRAPLIDVYGNAEAARYPVEPYAVRQLVARQLVEPVRFAQMIAAMYADGVRTFVEVGPGNTLTGLLAGILDGSDHLAISLDRVGRHGVTSLHDALGRLSAAGVPITFDALWAPHGAEREEPRPLSAAAVKISGGNLGKPYPATTDPAPAEASIAPAPWFIEPPAPTTEPRGDHSQPVPPQRPAPAMFPSPEPGTPNADLLTALVELQRQTAEAHAAYLRMAEQSVTAITTLLGTGAEFTTADSGREPSAGPALIPAPTTVSPEPLAPPMAAPPVPAPAAQPTEPPPPRAPLPAAPEPDDVEALVLSAVAQHTGYPVELLGPQMELDTDLGIDSITRVQILATLRPLVPKPAAAAETGLAELMALRTVGDIAARMRELAAGEPAPDPAHASGEGAFPLTRMTFQEVRSARDGSALPGLGHATVVIVDHGDGLAPALADELTARDIPAEVSSTVPPQATAVVLLGGLAKIGSPEEALAVQRAAFHTARAIAPRLSAEGGVLVTVQDTGGDFGSTATDPTRAWLGGLAALARTAAREWPKASVKAIDCERADRDARTIARDLADELLLGGATQTVGLIADGRRLTPGLAEERLEPGPPADLGPDPVIVATGGGRGITAAALRALAGRYRARFLLLGRTELLDEPTDLAAATTETDLARLLAVPGPTGTAPTPAQLRATVRQVTACREIRATLAALEQAGSQARYAAVDIRDQAELNAELDRVRADWGPVTGVLHGAGVLADKLIVEKTDEQFDRVFDTKVEGLRALLAATADDPLRLLHVFSSVSAVFGNAGQCDYAMANQTLHQVVLAEQKRRPDCQVRALIWGPWQGGMITPAVAEHLREQAVPLISWQAGTDAYLAETTSTTPPVQVALTAGTRPDAAAEVSGDHLAR